MQNVEYEAEIGISYLQGVAIKTAVSDEIFGVFGEVSEFDTSGSAEINEARRRVKELAIALRSAKSSVAGLRAMRERGNENLAKALKERGYEPKMLSGAEMDKLRVLLNKLRGSGVPSEEIIEAYCNNSSMRALPTTDIANWIYENYRTDEPLDLTWRLMKQSGEFDSLYEANGDTRIAKNIEKGMYNDRLDPYQKAMVKAEHRKSVDWSATRKK